MSVLELTDKQVLSLIQQVSPETRRAALLLLAERADRNREQRMAKVEERLRLRARERGLNWDALDEAARERFVDQLLHEP